MCDPLLLYSFPLMKTKLQATVLSPLISDSSNNVSAHTCYFACCVLIQVSRPFLIPEDEIS